MTVPLPRLARGRAWITRALGGIRGRMIVLLMAAGIPVTAIAVTNALQDYRAALNEGRREVEALRAVMAVHYGSAINTSEALLTALARIDPWQREGEAGCDTILRRLIDLHPGEFSHLWIATPDRPPLCGEAPGQLELQPLIREALSSGGPVFGTFAVAPGSRISVLPLAVPVAREGDSGRVVLATVILRDFALLSRPSGRTRGGESAWLVDRAGTPLLLTGGSPVRRPSADLLARLDDSAEFLQPDSEGGDLAYAAAPLTTGLRLVVGHPVGAVEDAARAVLIQRIMELATFLLACLAAIVIGADLAMVRPLRLLSVRVRGWRPGNAFRVSPSGTEPREVREVEQAFSDAATALTRREADLRAALDQRDALMAEIHHRVKNNLQIVSSLLNLQAGRIGDPAAAAEFLAARNRVRALATLHRHLYQQHSFETVSLRPFLTELANQQFASHSEAPGERIALRLDVADIGISTDQAVSLSLFVTEAVGNAVEHAFPDQASGTVWLSVAVEGGDAVITVQDDGLGLPDRGARPRGLGLQLMEGFAKQLGGQLTGGRLEGSETGAPRTGTRWVIRFPIRANAAPRALAP
jgi:two-component sensor histidine kinase